MTEPQDRFTIAELSDRVADALAVGYSGPASGQVRAVPDTRTIRYYSTLGLLDRPVEMRGRTAIYGPRHLQQLVAIKRLQAEGKSLAEVQAQLTGVSDGQLAALARLPEAPRQPRRSTRATRDFWRQPPSAPAAAAPAPPPAEPAPSVTHARALVEIELAPGVRLLVDQADGARLPDRKDIEAIRAAAVSLVDTLENRGLRPPR